MNKLLFIFITACIVSQLGTPQRVFGATNDATVEVLGGGGGGGVVANAGGGGGGGGEYHRCTETLSVQSYTVTVGAGGSEDANPTVETDSVFSGTGISMTADGGDGTGTISAGVAGTGGTVTGCDVGPTTFAGGTSGAGTAGTADTGGGGGGGAGYGGKGGDGATQAGATGGGGGGGGGESGAGGNTTTVAAGAAGSGGGGAGGVGVTTTYGASSNGAAGTPATYHIVGGGGGGGGDNGTRGGACGAPGAGSGGGEITGAGAGCRGEVRIIYVDSEVDATGGTETTSGSFRIHTFTTSGTFTVNTITSAPPPTVTTNFANPGATTATLYGTKTGGEDATQHGFAWGTSATMVGDTATTTLGALNTNSSFSSGVSGLSTGTTYYFRAYATGTSGTGYGIIRSFVTGNSTATRKLRLFEGFTIKFRNGRIIINQQ